MLLLKPLLCEVRGEVGLLYAVAELMNLALEVTALEAEDAIWHCVVLLLANVLPYNLHHIRQRHNGA